MTPDEIGKIVADAANRGVLRDTDEAIVRRAQAAIVEDLCPVRPLASRSLFALSFFGVFAAFAAVSASALGLHGVAALAMDQFWMIVAALAGAAWLGAAACVNEMSPAGGKKLDGIALAAAAAGFPILFAGLFHDYSARNLIKEGIPCLVAGLAVALPAGAAIAWILRRGFVLRGSAAGLAAGVLAGLSGLGMLELHCGNLKAIHVIVWHVAVVLTSAIAGFAAGSMAGSTRRTDRREGDARRSPRR